MTPCCEEAASERRAWVRGEGVPYLPQPQSGGCWRGAGVGGGECWRVLLRFSVLKSTFRRLQGAQNIPRHTLSTLFLFASVLVLTHLREEVWTGDKARQDPPPPSGPQLPHFLAFQLTKYRDPAPSSGAGLGDVRS